MLIALGFYTIRLRSFYARLNERKYFPALYALLNKIVARLCFCLVVALLGNAWAHADYSQQLLLLALASLFQMRMAEIARGLREHEKTS